MSWREMSLWFRSRKYSQKAQEEMYLSCEKKKFTLFFAVITEFVAFNLFSNMMMLNSGHVQDHASTSILHMDVC